MIKNADSFAEDDARTVAIYSESVAHHRGTYRASRWGSEFGQTNRFAALAGIGLAAGESVLDVGCGEGDLLGWFRRSNLDVDYSGIDITPGMIESALANYPDASFRLIASAEDRNFGEAAFDYVFASGIFTFRRHAPFQYLTMVVEAMFSASRKGVAFNCLSAWYENGDPEEYREDPVKVFEFCRSLSPRVALRHDYHPGDFTIYAKRT